MSLNSFNSRTSDWSETKSYNREINVHTVINEIKVHLNFPFFQIQFNSKNFLKRMVGEKGKYCKFASHSSLLQNMNGCEIFSSIVT